METSSTFSDSGGSTHGPDRGHGAGRSVWSRRRSRALSLASELPEAEERLLGYADLLAAQARVATRVPAQRWLALASAGAAAPPRVRLDRLPVAELVPLLAEFLAATPELGGDGTTMDAGLPHGLPGADGLDLLGAALAGAEVDEDSPFHVRAFLQPIATALAAADGSGIDLSRGERCFICGGTAVVASLADLPGASASRCLTCGMCGKAWRLPRRGCARCGADDADAFASYTDETSPWVSVDVCRSCRRYLKTVDLRRRPDAIPLVDDIATVRLDRWAGERGLERVHAGLLGI